MLRICTVPSAHVRVKLTKLKLSPHNGNRIGIIHIRLKNYYIKGGETKLYNLIRNELGQIISKEDLDCFFFDEDENWKDHKIAAEDIRFPVHVIETYPVKIYHISELV
jgi:hypothetical protein